MQDNSTRNRTVGRAVVKTGKEATMKKINSTPAKTSTEAKQTLASEVQGSLKWGRLKKWKGK